MAERRMFTQKVTNDDSFVGLSSTAQALYLHLCMAADDDGMTNQVAISLFKAHASEKELDELIDRKYIIRFPSGVVCIKHWRMSNAIRKDRYTATKYQTEYGELKLKTSGAYTLSDDGEPVVAERLPSGCQVVAERLPQDSIGKDSLVKISLSKVNERKEDIPSISTLQEINYEDHKIPLDKMDDIPTLSDIRGVCVEHDILFSPYDIAEYYGERGWSRDWVADVVRYPEVAR